MSQSQPESIPSERIAMCPLTENPLLQQITILHLSDLHLGLGDREEHTRFLSLVETKLRTIRDRLTFDVVVFSGDLVDSNPRKLRGEDAKLSRSRLKKHRLRIATDVVVRMATAVGVPLCRVVVCPGNHDFERTGTDHSPGPNVYGHFIRTLQTLDDSCTPLDPSCTGEKLLRYLRLSLWGEWQIVLVAMNSNDGLPRASRAYAQVSKNQVAFAKRLLDQQGQHARQVRVAVLHHGLGPDSPQTVKDGVFGVRKKLLREAGIDFCLGGHAHWGHQETGNPPIFTAGRLFPKAWDTEQSSKAANSGFGVIFLLASPHLARKGIGWALAYCTVHVREKLGKLEAKPGNVVFCAELARSRPGKARRALLNRFASTVEEVQRRYVEAFAT
jgi:DNA repair exonuclease SbcCD nuclease subunit